MKRIMIALRITLAGIALALAVFAAPKQRVVVDGRAVSNGPESAGILADGYLYISGQGPQRPDGTIPGDFAGQARQALQNVGAVVEAAGLTSAHVVYTQAHLKDMRQAPALDEAYAAYFPGVAPARAVLGVADLPGGSIMINAVAVVDRAAMRPVQVEGYDLRGYSAGALTADRLYLSSLPAKPGAAGEVDRALDAFEAIARAAGLDLRHVVFVNTYLTEAVSYRQLNEAYATRFEHGNTPARATIFVSSLPAGEITFTGVAVRNLKDRLAVRPKNMAPSPTASPCVLALDTLFCSGKSGFIPGPSSGIYAATVEHQLRQTMRNLLDGLEGAGMGLADVVSTNVYLDDLTEQGLVDGVYAEYFGEALPARTVVQQITPSPASRRPDARGRYGTLEQISLIAVREASP
jgi:2-iminobutanoate/2-iminopropanoate deaminase